MLWNPAIFFGDLFTLASFGRWHFCQPISGLATAHFGAGQGESQGECGLRNSVVFLCIFASKIWMSSLKLPPRLIKFIQEVQADQTSPIPSRESSLWIILRTILCLVDWTSRVSWFLINLPTWIRNEVAHSCCLIRRKMFHCHLCKESLRRRVFGCEKPSFHVWVFGWLSV